MLHSSFTSIVFSCEGFAKLILFRGHLMAPARADPSIPIYLTSLSKLWRETARRRCCRGSLTPVPYIMSSGIFASYRYTFVDTSNPPEITPFWRTLLAAKTVCASHCSTSRNVDSRCRARAHSLRREPVIPSGHNSLSFIFSLALLFSVVVSLQSFMHNVKESSNHRESRMEALVDILFHMSLRRQLSCFYYVSCSEL